MSLRTAVIGAGLMGRWHAWAASRAGARVVAIVDSDAGRAAALARRHAGAVALASADALPADVDAVHVCTPTGTHESVCEAQIAAGRHVLVEKPLAPNADAADRLLRLARERGVLLCPVHQFPFQAGARAARRALARIGPVRHVDFTACSAGGEGHDDDARDAIALDILPHPFSLLASLLSLSLDALDWDARRPLPGELRVTGHTPGTTVSILVSLRGRPTVNVLRLFGERGTCHLDLYHGYAVVEPGHVSRLRKIVRPFDVAGRTLLRAGANLAGRALRREPAYPGLAELVLAFHRAAATGGPAPIAPAETIAVAAVRDRVAEIAGLAAAR